MEQNTKASWILNVKHWQLFTLFLAPYVLPYLFSSFRTPGFSGYWIELCSLIYLLTLFCGWIYFSTLNLYPLLPANVTMNIKKFKRNVGFAFFPSFILLAVTLYRETEGIGGSGFFALAVLIGLILVYPAICLIQSTYFMIKTLKVIELQRPVDRSDYNLLDFTIIYPLIGVWVLQPRINKAYELSGIT
ncbi:hypothetical protein QG516_24490 [Pedobacter gandavensis]|uniref:hypothetical protein n=1 Tax=Pedobacter TaxID=84567 RepID=UPI001C99DB3D|nr:MULTISPECIES: hypothetical protein [Pedobacter]WGQ09676.1 hypothetical protein QG516_24490 [Pedobacter gandavensis]